MSNFLDKFREKVTYSIWKTEPATDESPGIDSLIALGVLLWVVGEADGKFIPQEKDKLITVLTEYEDIPEEHIPVIMKTIEKAAYERIDIYTFTYEVSHRLQRDMKIAIVEQLFRVACIDLDLSNDEHEMIRKITNLFRLDHKDFIDAKIKVKKEFGMHTAGL